jgi:hypothetical protein
MFERILIPPDHSPLAGCVLPQAILPSGADCVFDSWQLRAVFGIMPL